MDVTRAFEKNEQTHGHVVQSRPGRIHARNAGSTGILSRGKERIEEKEISNERTLEQVQSIRDTIDEVLGHAWTLLPVLQSPFKNIGTGNKTLFPRGIQKEARRRGGTARRKHGRERNRERVTNRTRFK